MGIRRVTVVDPYDLDACDRAVMEELATPEPSVIISRRPSALLKPWIALTDAPMQSVISMEDNGAAAPSV